MRTSSRYATRPLVQSAIALIGATLRFVAAAIRRQHERRRAEAQLISLDDRMLKDIGLSRGEIMAAVHGLPTKSRGRHVNE